VLLAQSLPLEIKLVPESTNFSPGKSLQIAVQLHHAEKHHSYWLNPGGPGKATQFQLKPETYQITQVLWPTPHITKTADVINYSYESVATALLTVQAPADAKVNEPIELELTAAALVCSDNCVPVKAKASQRFTVAAEPVASSIEWNSTLAEAQKHLPTAPAGWSITATNDGGQIALVLEPQTGAHQEIQSVYFFSTEEVIDSQQPQKLEQQGNRWLLKLPALAGSPTPEKLSGVITAEPSWLADQPERNAFQVQLNVSQGSLQADSASSTVTSNDSAPNNIGFLLFSAFVGGLILNVMPCVFPVIGIKIMGFVNQAGGDKKQILLHSLAYTAGVLVCFWALAYFVITLGKGWGAQLQEPWFVMLLCLFFIAFGLNMAGVFEIGASAVGVGQNLQRKEGLSGSFFSGLLATVVATPCSAPFLGPALTWAISLPVSIALLVFTVIGLGLSSPYIILSLAPQLLKLLPRPGAWMESFKQGMSFLLFGTAGYMLWILAGQVPEGHVLTVIFAMVIVAFGCWVYGRWCLPHKSAKARVISGLIAALSLASGVALGWPPSKDENSLSWQPWSPDLVKALVDEGNVVYVDFTARWCSTCLVNKGVYDKPEVRELFAKHKVVLVKADWTDNNDKIAKALFDLKAAAVPLNVIYAPKHAPLAFNDDNLFASEIREALGKVGRQ
jgi:thiol:disulfide interchange protein DsbD